MTYISRTTILLCVLLILPGQSILSQEILTPQVSGSAFSLFKSYCFGYYHDPLNCWESLSTWVVQGTNPDERHVSLGTHARIIRRKGEYWAYIMKTEFDFRTILEFEIAEKYGENPFPPAWMTTWNWNAELKGFKVIAAAINTSVLLFKQFDCYSDGTLAFSDFHSSEDFITYLCEEPPPSGDYLDAVDITDILRENLFGSEQKDFIGFVLKLDNTGQIHLTSPHIIITADQFQTPTPSVSQTPTPNATNTPIPSYTPMPSATPTPSPAPSPSASPIPTSTPIPSASPTPSASSTPSASPSASPIPTSTPIPSASPTPTIQPTATVFPTATPEQVFRVTLDLSGSVFLPGDTFRLAVNIEKQSSQIFYNQPLFVLLDVYDEYYFYPSWSSDFDFRYINLSEHIETVVLFDFTWPDVTDSASGLVFYAAILSPSLSSIAGNWDSVTFGWAGQ